MLQLIRPALRCSLLLRCKNGSWKRICNKRIPSDSHTHVPLFWSQKCFRSTCNVIIGETDLLLEDGMDIQELPVIVRKITEAHIPQSPIMLERLPSEKPKRRQISQLREIKEMIEGFNKCHSQNNVFTLLELIPRSEITPSVALQAFKKIVKFENSQEFRSKFDIDFDDENPDTLKRSAVIYDLIDIIVTSEDNNDILEALKLVSDEMSDETELFIQKLCDEVLIRIADNKFSISEICSSAKFLMVSGNQFDIDKLWVGVMERQNDINETNIMEVFRILLNVNLSRSLLLKILQKQLENVSLKLTGENVAEILSILNDIVEYPATIIQCLSNWLNIKILLENEDVLINIIEEFMDLPSLEEDEDVVNALEKFIEIRGKTIENPELMGIIMDYCNKKKIRSPVLFNGCSEYFVENAKNITPFVLKSICIPFGNLNFLPDNEEDFWRILEEQLDDKFVQFYCEDALDIMLSFIFVQKHPLKLVTKIFNPYFLDRLHSLKNPQHVHLIRTKLKLLDTALTLECNLYKGPLLHPDLSSHLIKQDPRIQRVSDSLLEVLPILLGQDKSVASSVVLKNLPLTELYIIDMIVHPKGKPSLFCGNESWNDFTAFLIHPPEHYDSKKQFLIGSQVMRRRHLKCIGLNVVDLNYETINSLLPHETELLEYIKSQLSKIEET